MIYYGDMVEALNAAAKILEESMLKESKDIIEERKEYMETRFSERPHDYYDRTGEYADSLELKGDKINIKGKWEYLADIYFNVDKIVARDAITPGNWGIHQSIYAEDMHEWIPYWMEYGQNSPISPDDGIQTISKIDHNDVKKGLIYYLRNLGLDII